MSFFCYMLECKDGSFYSGWTKDLEKRLAAHNSGKGARYTRSRLPVALVYFEELDSQSAAMHRERELKKKDHAYKLNLARTFDDTN